MSSSKNGRSDKEEESRLDRELIELLNELRVALPGVQVLFAFLLILPFTRPFDSLTDLQRDLYFASFLSTAVASVLLIAPSAHHRLTWRQLDREHMLNVSNRSAIGGMFFLGVAIMMVVYLVADVLFGTTQALVATGGVAALIAWFWYVRPLWRRWKTS